MRNAVACLLLAAAVGLGSAAYAADPPAPAAKPAAAQMGPGMMGHSAMGHGARGHGAVDWGTMSCMGLSEARLAAVKAELNLTSAQLPAWNVFVEAQTSSAAVMRQGMMQGAGPNAQPGAMMTGSLPERLERRETMMTASLEALRKVRAAVSPLYAALTPDQRAKADRLLCGQMGGPGMAKGRHAHPHHPQ